MTPTTAQVEEFLKNIREKIKIFNIVYRPRDKNTKTLAELDIAPSFRDDIINRLTFENYYRGPCNDTHDPQRPDYYEFGTEIKGIVVYIKLALGLPNKQVDCMSFHKAESSIEYPLKGK